MMTLRSETVLANSATQNKRKSMTEHDNLENIRNSKIFKDASEFFDQVSNPATEPAAEDVLVEKEVIKGPKVTHKVKKEVEDDEIVVTNESNEPAQDSDEGLNITNLLVDSDSLLLSDDDEDNLEAGEKFKALCLILQNITKKSIDKSQSVIYETLKAKNKQIEILTSENRNLKKDFACKVKVKKEALEDDLEKSKWEYKEKIKNIDEEQEYLIEEIKVKDEELKKKESSLKDITLKLSKSEQLIQELQKSLIRADEKNARLEGKISWLSKKRPQKSDVENRLLKSEEDLEKMREEKQQMEKKVELKDDDVARLEEQKYFLENSLLEKQLEIKKKDEQKMYLEKDIKEQKDHFEKQLNDLNEGIKTLKSEKLNFQKEMKEADKQMKLKVSKIKELEASLAKTDVSEKATRDKQSLKLKQLNDASKVAEERIQELNSTVQKLQEENNTIILEDLKVIGQGREEINELKSKMTELEANVESLEREKGSLQAHLAGKDQEQISLQIILSEKDEVIVEKNKCLEKMKKKNEKLKTKIIETQEMKDGLDNRVTITEMKYFNLEKELSLKQSELKEVTEKHQKDVEKIELEKKEILEETEKQKLAMEEKIKTTKSHLLKQINLIKKKSGDKIVLSTDTIVL